MLLPHDAVASLPCENVLRRHLHKDQQAMAVVTARFSDRRSSATGWTCTLAAPMFWARPIVLLVLAPIALACCATATLSPSAPSSAPAPSFQVVRLEWRWESVTGQPCEGPPPGRTGCVLYRATGHGIFKNVGARGSALVTFFGFIYNAPGHLGQPTEDACHTVIAETSSNGVAEAACQLDGLLDPGSHDVWKAPGVRVNYGAIDVTLAAPIPTPRS